MKKLIASGQEDIEHIARWIKSDPYHGIIRPHWWVTGAEGSLLAFCLKDERGVLCYVRLDEKDSSGFIRLHTQFGPTSEVPSLRLTKGMLWCVPVVIEFSKKQQAAGIVFQSESESLIGFMQKKFGFQPAGGDDFILYLQEG